MKKTLTLICILIMFFSRSIFGWDMIGLLNVHEPINDAAVSFFQGSFEKHSKNLDTETKFLGVAWHNESKTTITLDNSGISRSETFREWVKIGGVDADVDAPNNGGEKPLRHFYDPVFSPRYLTNIPNLINNPRIDHVDWAYNNDQHHWSFIQGLHLYKAGMENINLSDLPNSIAGYDGYFVENTEKRTEQMFAASFRALGETLHCAGDMCIPAHVRNDSHGGIGLGGVDPIESTVTYASATQILSSVGNLPGMIFLNSGKSVKEILIGCSTFTNSKFYSTDSIFNANPSVTPNATPRRDYPTPSFSEDSLTLVDKANPELRRIYANISNVNVILAERTFVAGFFGREEEVYRVPLEASFGQAKVLLPLAAAAGGEIIDRFLPTMKLGLTVEKDNGSSFKLIGSLTHEIEKDIEWQSIGEIKYNGFGEIHVNGSAIATATFINGQMIATATFNDKDKVQLIVKAGALIHKSNIVEVSAEEIIPPSLISVKSPEFIQTLSSVGLDSSSRRIGYIITEIPDIIATIQSSNSKYMVFNWWVDNAVGTIADAYFGGEITATNLEEDSVWISRAFEQLEPGLFDFKTSFDFSRWQRGKICIPSGEHVLHAEGYYHESFHSHGIPDGPEPRLGLLGVEGNYRTVSLDIPFEVQQLASPAKQPVNNWNADSGTKREISFSKIETNPEAKTEGYSAPAWAPSNWHCLFKFDGAYTYYFDSKENSPDDKISGHYKDGNPDGLWEIKHWDKQWKFSYGSDGTIISGVEEYYKKELVKKYTSSSQANPNLLITHDHANDTSELVVRNALVETFGYTKEEYNLENGKKNGSYSYVNEYSTTANGSYLNDIPTGHWKIIDTYSKKEFDLDSEGNVLSGIEIYRDGNLEFKYTSSDFVNPSFEAIFNAPTTLNVKTGKVEWFHDSVTEVYHIKDYKKEGPYNSADSSNGKTIQGQYENNSMTGVWTYFDPARNPSEYTKTY